MPQKVFEGCHVNRFEKIALYYEFRYELRPIGIVYDAAAGFGGPRAHFVHGVVPWGFVLRCLTLPRKLVEQMVRDDIDILDLKKFKIKLSEVRSNA